MNMNCSIHTLNLPCNFVLLMISRPLSACSFTPFPCSVSFRLQLYHLPRLLTGAFDTVGIVCPPMWNSTFSSTLPLFRDRLRDFSGLNFILDHVISESSLFSICCALLLQFAITVVSSMKALSGGIYTPFLVFLPQHLILLPSRVLALLAQTTLEKLYIPLLFPLPVWS